MSLDTSSRWRCIDLQALYLIGYQAYALILAQVLILIWCLMLKLNERSVLNLLILGTIILITAMIVTVHSEKALNVQTRDLHFLFLIRFQSFIHLGRILDVIICTVHNLTCDHIFLFFTQWNLHLVTYTACYVHMQPLSYISIAVIFYQYSWSQACVVPLAKTSYIDR